MPIVTIFGNPHDMRDCDTRHFVAFRMALEPFVDERCEFFSRLCPFVAHRAFSLTPGSPPLSSSAVGCSSSSR
jgi:hypothetical protein